MQRNRLRFRQFILTLAGLVMIISPSLHVFALSADQQNVYINGVQFYDVNGGGTCTVDQTSDINLTGNTNAEKAFNYFIGKGLTAPQAAGIVGNLIQESNVNPHDPGFGIAQWGGGRYTALQNFAQQEGKPIGDLAVQLDFMWHELNQKPRYFDTLTKLKQTTSVDDSNYDNNATVQFMGTESIGSSDTYADDQALPRNIPGYESPGIPNYDNRVRDARSALKAYGGSASTASAIATSISGGDCSGVAGNGQNTKYSDGFTFYDQCDPQWGSKSYGDGTICSSGCGPSSMAMIITTLTGSPVTPEQTATYADSHGLFVNGAGSSWSIAPEEASNWNLKSNALPVNVGAITAALQAGALVAAPGIGPEPFTSAGHYIVIRAVTADGKWLIGDPDSAHVGANTKEWDPQQIVSSISGGVYAISK